jgi:hypothetical protein
MVETGDNLLAAVVPQLGLECPQRALGELIRGAPHLLLQLTPQPVGPDRDHRVKRDFRLRVATSTPTIFLHFDPPNQDDL